MLGHISLQHLSGLIQNMSKAEQADFMKQKTLNKLPPLHQQLFVLLQRNPDILPTAALQKLTVKSQAQFANLKNYLLETLIESLILNNNKEDLLTYGQQAYLGAELLLRKKQLALAERQNLKGLQFVTKSHQFTMVIQFIAQRQRILHLSRTGPYMEELMILEEARVKASLHLENLAQLRHLFSQLLSLSRESPIRFTNEQMQAVKSCAIRLEQLHTSAASNYYTNMFWLAAAIKAAFMQRHYQTATAYGASFISLLKEQKSLTSLSPNIFLETGNTLLYNLFASSSNSVSDLLALLDSIAIQQLPKIYQEKWKMIVLHTEIKIAHKNANYSLVAQLLQPYQNSIEKTPELFSEEERISFICSLAISHFVLESYEIADRLMRVAKKMNFQATREDILYFTSLFHLLVLFEKKDWYYLDVCVQATYQSLYARKKLRNFEKEIVLFIKKFSSLRTQPQLKEAATAMLHKLAPYQSKKNRQIYSPYFNFTGWLESKVMGCSYRNYCEQKLVSC